MAEVVATKITSVARTYEFVPGVELRTWMRLPSLIYGYESSKTVNISGGSVILFLAFSNSKVWPKPTFRITLKNYGEVIRKFEEVLSWFTDKSMQDLFFMDENNQLCFNTHYRNLKLNIYEAGKGENVLSIYPNCVEDSTGHRTEAVNMIINTEANIAEVFYSDFVDLVEMIKNFSFQAEAIQLLESYRYSLEYNSVDIPRKTFDNRFATETPKTAEPAPISNKFGMLT